LIRYVLIPVAVLALSACAGASTPRQAVDDPSMGPRAAKLEGYFVANPLDGTRVLGPPPTPDSPHGKADRAMFEETRKLEGSPRWQTAIIDNDLWGGGALKRFSCAMGVDLDAQKTPVTWRILHRVELDVRTVGTPAKNAYNRPRPLIGNDAPLCVPREDWMRTNSSYPSGHSMTTWSWGLILTELAPSKADPLLQVGREGGESRVICGVHFQSDVEAGRVMGSAMVARLHSEPAFAADMAAARREIAAAKAAPTGCGG